MTLKRFVSGIVAGSAVVMVSAMPGLAGQMPQHAATAKPQVAMGADMAAKCQTMMADREKMTTEMTGADRRLDDLVGKMNAASGRQKTDATAVVVNAMVTERRTMRAGMMKMQDGMMTHMMEHMQAGKESMPTCPMMKQMNEASPSGATGS